MDPEYSKKVANWLEEQPTSFNLATGTPAPHGLDVTVGRGRDGQLKLGLTVFPLIIDTTSAWSSYRFEPNTYTVHISPFVSIPPVPSSRFCATSPGAAEWLTIVPPARATEIHCLDTYGESRIYAEGLARTEVLKKIHDLRVSYAEIITDDRASIRYTGQMETISGPEVRCHTTPAPSPAGDQTCATSTCEWIRELDPRWIGAQGGQR